MATTEAQPLDAFATVKQIEDQYLFPTYARVPLLLERGKGVYVFDSTGKKYLDFITGIGVNALGHAHPRLLNVIKEQSKRVIHVSNVYYNEYQGRLAQRLVELSGMERAFFTVSGAEAAEGALKVARSLGQAISPDKFEVVALQQSFHGRTMGALSITGNTKYRAPFGPLLPGVKFIDANDEAALTAAVGPNTCAVIIEPVQGEGGIYPLSESFVKLARRLTTEHGAALICDEIQCGLGRTGKMFGYQWTGVTPDVVTVAKPIAGGYPLGAILARGAAATVLTSGLHGTTFGGGPLACRMALEVLDILCEPGMLDHIQEMSIALEAGLLEVAARRKPVKEVRVKGLMFGIQLDRPAAPAAARMIELGMLGNVTHDTVIRLLPPYIIERKHVDKAVGIVAKALRAV